MKSSPTQYWDSINPKTQVDVFKSLDDCELTIKVIERELGTAYLNAILVKAMVSFLKFYSVNNSMDAYQIADTINLITETYPYYSLDDFKLFFKNAKRGMYSDVYGRIDGSVIMMWLRKYDLNRAEEAKSISIRSQEAFKKNADTESLVKGTTYEEYINLKERAKRGDKEAINELTNPAYRK